MERRLTRSCNEVEPVGFDFLASAERKKKFLVKLFSKSLWVSVARVKPLAPCNGTMTFDSKVYCVILYMEDLPIFFSCSYAYWAYHMCRFVISFTRKKHILCVVFTMEEYANLLCKVLKIIKIDI